MHERRQQVLRGEEVDDNEFAFVLLVGEFTFELFKGRDCVHHFLFG